MFWGHTNHLVSNIRQSPKLDNENGMSVDLMLGFKTIIQEARKTIKMLKYI